MTDLNRIVILLLLGIAFFSLSDITAQTRQELEQQRQALEQEIRTTRSMLDESVRRQRNTVENLVTLQNQLESRRKVLNNLNAQIRLLNTELSEIRDSIKYLEAEIEELREVYFNQLRVAYIRNITTKDWMHLLSAGSLNEAIRRHLYNRQFRTYMNNRKEQLDSVGVVLSDQQNQLELSLKEMDELRANERRAVNELDEDRKEVDRMLRSLKGREQELRQDLQQQQQQRRQLTEQIDRLIAEEIARSEERRDELPEVHAAYEKLTGNFEQNRGKIPWPVERGIIQSRFGSQPHPTLRNVTINNNGIDIRTQEGTPIRAVFEGEVTAVVSMPGDQKMVLIRHGNYFTVYAGLQSIYVGNGDSITAGQSLGQVGRDPSSGNHMLHFELWRGKEPLNPEPWLGR